MKATKTVAQSSRVRKSAKEPTPRQSAVIHFRRLFAPDHGVVVLNGYGINVCVDRGHLMLEDGIGNDRRAGRFPRVYHGIRRVVVIGSDGMVSLAAIRWLADQKIAFTMLERDGSTLIATGPVAASDTRLRRAQACAQHLPAGVDLVKELIRQKLSGQEAVARERLRNAATGDSITLCLERLNGSDTIDAVRMVEGHGAVAYWGAWQRVETQFPKSDLARVPDHWRTFDTRKSPISGGSRKASNPVNAILNYLYTLLESETRLAITALGLDPGLGLLHFDQATRDGLVYDLMEPVRPRIDAYVLGWIASTPLKRSWFFEEHDGCCRLMSELTAQLSDTMPAWSREVAPIVEWFARELSSDTFQKKPIPIPGTRLTQRRRREAACTAVSPIKKPQRQQNVCAACGRAASLGSRHCAGCARAETVGRFKAGLERSREASRTPEASAKRKLAVTRQQEAQRLWQPSDLPDWLTDEVYVQKIQPALKNFSKAQIASVLGLNASFVYKMVNRGKIPHKRHWLKLAELVGLTELSE
jgi:CRISPR-associated endonuclease Cas1